MTETERLAQELHDLRRMIEVYIKLEPERLKAAVAAITKSYNPSSLDNQEGK